MKMIKYVLTPEGTIPDYIVDGGYLAVANSGSWPQNLDLVGVANDSATETSFANEAALLTYAQSKNFEFKKPHSDEIIPLETVVSNLWSKLG
jgi:hypothetical protein